MDKYSTSFIYMLFLVSIIFFTRCSKSSKNDQRENLKVWIDSLDRQSRTIGARHAMAKFDSLIQTINPLNKKEKFRYYSFKKILSNRDSSLMSQSGLYSDSLLALFADPKVQEVYPKEYSNALLNKGDDQMREKNYYNAYLNYFRGKTILRDHNEVCESAKFTSRIAKIFFEEGKFFNAIEFWKKEFEELQNCTHQDSFELTFIEKQGSLNNIGISFLAVNEPDSAISYFNRALDFIHKNESLHKRDQKFIEYAKVVIYIYQAEAYVAKGQMQIAENLLKKGLHHDPKIDWSLNSEREARLKLASMYVYQQKYKEALEQLTILKNQGSNSQNFRQINELEAIINLGMGNADLARNTLLQTWKQNITNVRIHNREQKSDIGRFLEHVQYESDMKLAQEQNTRQQILLLLLFVVILSLIIIGYMITRSQKKNMLHVQSLRKLNDTITQRSQALEEMVNAFEKADTEKNEIMRIVAHDLRNPIGAMVSASHLLFWDSEPSLDQKEIIGAMQSSGDKAIKLIEDLLEAHANPNSDQNAHTELNEMIQSCIDMLAHKADEKKQNVIFTPSNDSFLTDKKIWRVLTNLIGNAVKFTPTGGVIKIEVLKVGDKVRISVEDNGIGIPETLRDKIFESKPGEGRSGTAGEKSFGLGLHSCKQIIDTSQGKIWLESAPLTGTIFFIELPLL